MGQDVDPASTGKPASLAAACEDRAGAATPNLVAGPVSVDESYEFAYAQARRILDEEKVRAMDEFQKLAQKRRRVVAGLIVAWAAATAVLVAAAGRDMMVASEIALALVVAFAVFYLMPQFMGKGNLEEVFSQYEVQLTKLEAMGAPLPVADSIQELVDAIDAVSPDEESA